MENLIHYFKKKGFEFVSPLSGDASLRKFFRLKKRGQNFVLMVYPDPIDDSLDLLQVYRYLSVIFPLPRIFEIFPEINGILMEDAGDLSLEKIGSSEREKYYRELLNLSSLLIDYGKSFFPENHLVFSRALDQERFEKELVFTYKHFLMGYCECRVEEKLWREACREFIKEIEFHMALQHRDYHSRNVFVKGDKIFILDYQDTMPGPLVYDLVSLSRDNYVVLEEKLRKELEGIFLKRYKLDPLQLELVSMQRHLKALGTFGFQIKERNRTYFRKYIQNTFFYLQDEFNKLSFYKPVNEIRNLFINCKIL